MELIVAMGQDRRLAQEYYENFNRPEQQWARVGSADNIRAWPDEMRADAPHLAA
jgi:hypothetical protein